jgi:hypothetical protein
MKARQLLLETIKDRDTLGVAVRAFDMAWDQMQREQPVPKFAHEEARTRLASMMLAFTTETTRDAAKLKDLTLEALMRTPS